MIERFRIDRQEIGAAEVTTGGGSVSRTFEIPNDYSRISLYIVPVDSDDSANDSSIDVLYELNDQFFPLKGAIGGTAVRNEIFPFTTEDVFQFVKIDITAGINEPDEGYLLELWGYR